jgi:DNA-binding response OmpR family regulator
LKKILVIEDDADVRETIVFILEQEGYNTLAAENGEKGVLSAFGYKPDLVLCDMIMPGLDGMEVFSEISLIPNQSMTPFIFLSAKTDKADIRKAMHLGAADYITKPFDKNDLLSAIKTQLAKRDEITQKLLDEKLRLLGKLEKELLAKDLEIERLLKLKNFPEKNIESQKTLQVEKTTKKQVKTNSNILIIIENWLVRSRFIASIRDEFSCNLMEFDTLQEALKDNENTPIDYIIIESDPPRQDPLIMIRQIRRKTYLMQCPILVFAENIDKDILLEFAKLGNIDFILNPFNPEKLNHKIAKYIDPLK